MIYGNDFKILRKKVTTFRGLRIHQGKKKCQVGGQQQHCSATAGQTRGAQSQVANHSAEGSNVAEGRQVEDTGGSLVDTYSSEGGTGENTLRKSTSTNPSNQEPGQRTERKEPWRRQLVKWPKANKVAVWQQLDEDLSFILEHSLRGQVETKLNCIGDILYEECRNRFGVVAEKQKGSKQKGRREREIEQLVKSNGYIDTSCQTAGVPGFPGCVEHSAVIWEQIQRAKRERGDLHVVWLDLANAYGSVPHQLIEYALDFFYIPVCIRALVAKYFEDIKMCCTHQDFTTSWQQLEVGIAMGCSISPILFVAWWWQK